MSNTIRFKRGLESARTGVTPLEGEFLYTTDEKKLYVGDGSTAGGNLVTGIGAAIELVADGAIADGDLCIVTSAGKAAAVSSTGFTATAETDLGTGLYDNKAQCYMGSGGRHLLVYDDNSTTTYAQVITVATDGTITTGSAYTFGSHTSKSISLFPLSSSQAFVGYIDDSDGYAYYKLVNLGTGNTISSFGSAVAVNSATSTVVACCNGGFSISSSHRLVHYVYYDTSGTNTLYHKTINMNTAAQSSATSLTTSASGTTIRITPETTASSRVAWVSYVDNANQYPQLQVVSNSGSDTPLSSAGSAQTIHSLASNSPRVIYDDTNDQCVICYTDSAADTALYVTSATRSGFTITADTPVLAGTLGAASTDYAMAFDDEADIICIATYNEEVYVGEMDGASFSVLSNFTYTVSGNGDEPEISYNNTANLFLVTANFGGGAVAIDGNFVSNLTGGNYIGISDGAWADTETALIITDGGVSNAQSGLTVAQAYYVQRDGTLSTTPDSFTVYAGLSISATELIVKG